jgi:hypothetical protein
MYVGGFGGRMGSPSSKTTVENCFATGGVISQRSDSGRYYTGGFIGYSLGPTSYSHFLLNNAALGKSVTATGKGSTSNPRVVGRVYGDTVSGATRTNNYAYNNMAVTESDTYGANNSQMSDVTLTINRGEKDGGDAHLGIFRDRRFWTNPLPADNTVVFNVADYGLCFSASVWDFSTVESKGHPILRGVGGQ